MEGSIPGGHRPCYDTAARNDLYRCLILLNLSAAFDTYVHENLLMTATNHWSCRWFTSLLDEGIFTLVGQLTCLQRRVLSVHNATAGIVFRTHYRIDLKLAITASRVLHDQVPSCLGHFVQVADLTGRHRLRTAATRKVLTPTCSSRSFSVAASMLWKYNC